MSRYRANFNRSIYSRLDNETNNAKSTIYGSRNNFVLNTPLQLKVPKEVIKSGVKTKVYEDGILFYSTFKTYGGTETEINGKYSIEDTADVVCYYDPLITSDCKVLNLNTNIEYEILNAPEDINQRHQYLKFKVRAIYGGV